MTAAFLSGDGALARRSLYGDNHAARRLAARYLDRITQLGSALAETPEESAGLSRRAFRLALRGPRPFDDALVRAFGELAAERADAAQAQSRLLGLLVEVEGRPTTEVAPLLGIDPATARSLLPATRRTGTPLRSARPCRGWGLVAAPVALTPAERRAGEDHLTLCRRCRDRRAALERTRASLLGGSAGVVGAVVTTQAVHLGSGTGLGFALGGKVAAVVVGGAASAVLAAASAVAVTQPARFHPAPRPAVTAPVVTPQPSAGVPTQAPPAPRPATSAPAPGLPTVPVPLPTGAPRSGTPLPLPTTLPTSLPLPLPTPLTTLLPVPLPTEIPLPVDDLLP